MQKRNALKLKKKSKHPDVNVAQAVQKNPDISYIHNMLINQDH